MSKARDLADGTFDTDTLVVDAANNRVGIGTSSPAQSLEIVGATASSGAARSNVIITDNTAYAAGVGGGIVFRAKYNTAGSITNMSSIQGFKENSTDGNYAGGLLFTTRANGSANAERMRIDSDGLKFNGDTAAANALDDYEEGSFSPMTSTEANVYHARYTKIGNLVTINCCFLMKTGQSRNNISLPFTPANDSIGKNTASNEATNNRYAGTVSYFTPNGGTTPIPLMLFHQGNQGSTAYFIAKYSATTQVWPENVDDGYGAIAVSFTYQTNS